MRDQLYQILKNVSENTVLTLQSGVSLGVKITARIKISAVVFVAMFFLNLVVHGFVIGPTITRPRLVGIARAEDQLNFLPMLLDYLLLSIGFSYLGILFDKNKSYKEMAVFGFLTGFLVFLHFGLSAMFILPRWPLVVVITDSLATGFVWMILGGLIHYLKLRKMTS